MSRQAAVILGLPAACNPVKVKLIFEAECKVPIKEIKVDSKKATVELTNEQDYRTFLANFPKSIKFGNVQHVLKIQSEDVSPTNPSLSHSTPESKRPVPWVHTTVQHWSSLKQLPACKSGLLVQPSDVEISPQSIREYFENNQKSCGGPIQEMIPMVDGIFIKFKEEDVSEKVWNFRPHRICGKSVTVYCKLVPAPFRRKIIIKGQGDRDLENEKLRSLLHQCSTKSIFPKGINKLSFGVFSAVYNDDVDEQDIEEILKEFKKNHSAYDVSFLVRSDCIRIRPVPSDISDGELEILFENRERTGGGNVTRIDRLGNCELLVYFSSHEDVEGIAEKFRGKTLPVFGANMKLRPHFQGLQAVQIAQEKQHRLDQYYHTWLKSKGAGKDENPNEASFWYGNVDADVLKFFMKRNEHVQILNLNLNDLGVAAVTEHGIKIMLKKAGVNHEVVRNMVQAFMTSYISMKCEVSQEMSKQLADNCPDDVCTRLADLDKQKIIVTGVKTEVESFVQSLKFTSDLCHLHLQEDVIIWLVETKMLDQLRKDYAEIADYSQSEVNFFGEREKILAAKSAIIELVKKLRLVKFTSNIPDFVEFLKEAGRNGRIASNVLEVWMKQRICATLVIKQDGPYILTPPDCTDMALAVLRSALTHDEMEVQSASLDIKQMPAWKKIKAFESEGKLRIKVKKDGVLAIVGFRHHVTNAMKELQQYGFKHKHKKLIKMEQGMAQHVTQIIDDFQTLCQKKHVSYELSEEGIVVKGKKDDVDIVSDEIEKWKIRLVKKAFTVKTFGAADFFGTTEGEHLLTTASANHKATVIFNSEPRPKGQTSGGSAQFLRSSQVSLEEKVSSIMIGPLKVSVRRGNIVEETNDAIVNSVGPKFDLREGMLSSAVLEKGGPQIQSDLNRSNGYIRITSNGKLKCRRIFHVAFPSDEQKFIECLVEVLQRADGRKGDSLSMPAVGTGPQGLPCSVMARIILKSIMGFSKTSPQHLRVLDIVLLEPLHLQDFQKELFNFGKKEGLLPATPRPVTSQPISQLSSDSKSAHLTSDFPNSVKIGNITLSVRQGDITEESNHAIVNSTGATFDLSYGMVSRAIINKGGYSIQQEVKTVRGNHIRVTAGGNLKCIKILHVVTPSSKDKIGESIKRILATAEKEYFPSLSIPAIGTGNLRMAVADVARIVLKAVREFMSNDPKLTCLSKVDFVIFDKEQMKEFRDAIFKDAAGLGSSVDKPQKKQPELLIYSLERGKVKEVIDWIKLKLLEALETTINHAKISRFTTKEDEYLSSCEKSFNVHITRSDDKIVIQGLQEDVQKAADKVNGLLQGFLPYRDRYFWEYCDELSTWHCLEIAVSEEIEKAYRKYLQKPLLYKYYYAIINSKKRLVNFASMEIDSKLKLRRRQETDVDADTALKAEDHFGDSGRNDRSSKSGGSSMEKKKK